MTSSTWGSLVGAALLVFGVAFGISFGVTRWVRKRAPRWGLVDRPGGRKIHETVLPLGGGIAIMLTTTLLLVAGVVGADVLASLRPEWLPDWVRRHQPGAHARLPVLMAVLGGGLVVFSLGLVDDLRGLGPRPKLVVEGLVALGLVFAGVRISFFLPFPALGMLGTLGWILLVTNAFNLLDNMDGLSAGVASIVCLLLFGVSLQTGHWFVAAYGVVFLGAVLGFLVHNWSPASILMGDAGSLYVGYTISVLMILSTFYEPTYPIYPVVLPFLVLAVPFYDTLSVVFIRWREGRPIQQGDQSHLSHRLVAMGMGRREAVLTIYLLTLACGVAGLVLYHTNEHGARIILLQVVLLLLIVVLLERAGQRGRR